jgi:hypothetical protein
LPFVTNGVAIGNRLWHGSGIAAADEFAQLPEPLFAISTKLKLAEL